MGDGMDGGVAVSSPMRVVFERGNTEADVTLSAAALAKAGRLTAGPGITLPNARTITPASLQVEIVPREFALAFTTLNGSSLEAARMQAGATMQVRLTLSGDSSLGEDETLTVSFAYEREGGGTGADVMVQELVSFSNASGTTIDLTLEASAAARSGTLMARVEDAMNAVITSASLRVEILSREFALAFMPSVIGIVAGTTENVVLRLENAARLEAGEQVPVVLVLPEGSSLTVPSTRFIFGRSTDTHVVAVGVPAGAMSGSETLQATVADSHGLVNVDFAPASAAIRVNVIDSRDFRWVFRSVETSEVVSTVVVVVGSSQEVVLSLEGDQGAVLRGGESVGVSLSFMGGAAVVVTPPELTFTSAMPTRSLILQATGMATPDRLVVSLTGTTPEQLPDATVEEMGALPVELVRGFTLAFATLDDAPLRTARVQAGTMTQVRLSLSGAAPLNPDETLPVTFAYDPVDGGVTVEEATRFTAGTTTIDLTLSAAVNAARVSTLTASVSGVSPDMLPITPADLPVEILPREFTLSFVTLGGDPLSSARMLAGGATQVLLTLSGEASLGPDEVLKLDFVYEPRKGGVMVTPASADFTSRNTVVTLTLEAESDAQSGILMADLSEASNISPLPSADLAVTVLPTREFALAFTTLNGEQLETARVQAGATTQVRLTLSGDGSLSADERLTVSFAYDPPDDGVLVREAVVFTAGNFTADLTLNAPVAAQSGVLTAHIEDVVNVVTTPASVQVEILPRKFALAFTTLNSEPLEMALVRAGATTRVRLTLSGDGSLVADERLTVSFAYDPPDDGVSVREAVVFTAGNFTADLTLNAPVAARPRPGTLTAHIEDVPNTRIAPATLPIEILSSAFALAFTTLNGEQLETARVQAGATTQVRLTLSGDGSLSVDERLTVSFAYDPPDDGVLVREAVVFTAGNFTADLTLNAPVAAQPGTLTAHIEDAVNVVTTPASVQVEILPREFALAFTTLDGEQLEAARVQEGDTTRVRLTLSGDGSLVADERLTVSFAYDPPDDGVSVREAVVFTAGNFTADLTLNAPAAAQPGTLTAHIEDVPNTRIAPATLPIEILPSAFALAFTTLDGEQLETARVVAGATTRVRLTLSDDGSLGVDERLRVSFAYDPPDGGVSVREVVIFSAGRTGRLTAYLTLRAVADAQPGTLTASIAATENLVVSPAQLPVEILPAPRQFRVLFSRTYQRVPIQRSTISDTVSFEIGVSLNQVKLEPGETATAHFTVASSLSTPGLTVTPATVEFSAEQRSTVIILTVERKDAQSDFYFVYGRFEKEGHSNAEFRVTSLWVVVDVERIFSLVFEPANLLIRSGERSSARLSLVDLIAPLRSFERVEVRLTAPGAEGVRIVPEVVTFSGSDATESMIELIVDGEAPRQRFTLDVAVLPTSYVRKEVSYVLTTLPVEIMPIERNFNLVLNWRRPTVELLPSERSILPVALVSVGDALLRPGERVVVDLSIGGEGVSVVPARIVFDSDTRKTTTNVYFKSFTLIADTYVPTSQSLSLTGSISDDDSVLPDEVTVSIQSPLFVVVPRILFRYEYRLDFEPSMLTAALDAGELTASRTINSRLRAKLFATVGSSPEFLLSEGFYLEDAVRFSLSVEGEGVTVSEPTLSFTRFERRQPVELQIDISDLDVSSSVFLSTLTATPVAPVSANVAMTGRSLLMKVIASPPPDPALAFASSAGDTLNEARVLAGSSTLVRLVLDDPTLLQADDVIAVAFDTTGISVVPPASSLTSVNLSRVLMLSASYDANPGNSGIVARARLLRSGGSQTNLEPVRLPMQIVERRFALEFAPSTLTVAAGSTASVSLSLRGIEDPSGLGVPGLGADEVPLVTFSYDQTGVAADGRAFAFNGTRVDVLLSVGSDATSGTLVASVPDLMNATVEMATLSIEVGALASSESMRQRQFALAFGLDSLLLTADDTVSVPLSLRSIDGSGSGASGLDVGEVVPVELSYTGAGLTIPFNLVFTVDDTQIDVSVSAALNVTPGILSAFILDLPNATVEMAALPVNVLLSPVSYGRLSLAFASSPSGLLQSLQVLTGVSTRVRLVLAPPGRLSSGETVLVALSASAGASAGASAALAVEPSSLTLTSAVPEGVLSVTAARESATTGRIFVASAWLISEGGNSVALAPVSLAVSILAFEAPEMVEVPAGSFEMGGTQGTGNSDELPAHEVAVARFAVSKYEITRAQYAAFVAATGHDAGSCWNDPGFTQSQDHPAVCVSWSDAKAYVGWLSERTGRQYGLLSEAEWEYAARAGTLTRYPFGNDAASLRGLVTNCNEDFCGDGHERTSPVGSFSANGFGLYDMSGNAREWVEDCYHADYTAVPTDGSAWTSACGFNDRARVIRGGSWSDGTEELRSSHRAQSDLDERSATHGFRVRAPIPD